MKLSKLRLISGAVLLACACLAQAEIRLSDPLPLAPEVTVGKLPNGLTYYIKKNARPAQKVELRLVVKAGSILEDDDQQGLAHFTEHMAFNGSTHFKRNELISYLQSIGVKFGADLNAYTSFDETVFVLPIPTNKKDNLEKGFLVLEDWAHGLKFNPADINSERGIVLEEARLGKGASDRMNKVLYPKLLNGSRYAQRMPIGKESVLKTFKPEAIKRLYKDWYRPDLMAVMVVGDVEPSQAEKLIRQHFGKLKNPAQPRPRLYAEVPQRSQTEALVITDKEAPDDTVFIRYPIRAAQEAVTIADYRRQMIENLYGQMLSARMQELTQQANPPFIQGGSSMGKLVRGYESFSAYALLGKGGVQPAVDHFKASTAVDITGVDIYHPTEDDLTGKEIAFGGDMTRSTKDGRNYLVLETEAQGQHGWVPFPGQLRLQAYSHLASGADMVEYWHWHSIHNSFETYWKGLLSHDLEPNPTYREAGVFGREIAKLEVGERLVHLKKHNKVAIMVSNESLTALDWFLIEAGFPFGGTLKYNDVVRNIYDALFELNVECDFIPSDAPAERLAKYEMIVTPALYCTPQETTDRLREFVSSGGHLVSTMRSFVTDDEVTVWHDRAPHNLTDVFGMTYNQFTRPNGHVSVEFAGTLAKTPASDAQALIELVTPFDGTDVLASYGHYAWKDYAAVTRHGFGKGDAEWIATLLDADTIRAVLREAVEHAGIADAGTALAGQVTVRRGTNARGEQVTYLLNYSADEVTIDSPVSGDVVVAPVVVGTDGTVDESATAAIALKEGSKVEVGDRLTIGRWNVVVIAG